MALSAVERAFYPQIYSRMKANIKRPYTKVVRTHINGIKLSRTDEQIVNTVKGVRQDLELLIAICDVFQIRYNDLIPSEYHGLTGKEVLLPR